jgi:SAM-dependent methyltransferase
VFEQSAVPLGGLNWGDLRRMDPVSEHWGFDRGLPVDRYYIETFLAKHAADIHGRCLEVMTPAYVERFGGDRVTEVDVIDIDPHNAFATITGDLTVPGLLADNHYDCFVMTQTLPVIYDGRALVRQAYSCLRPGGILLVTAPTLCRYSPHPEDHWRLTDRSLRRLLEDETDGEITEVDLHGNLVACIGFLTGLATADLSEAELTHFDNRFPVVVSARLRKPA